MIRPKPRYKTNKKGAPPKQIDWDLVDDALRIQCTQQEVCSLLRISENTLISRCVEKFDISFGEYCLQRHNEGRVSMRREMMRRAMRGSDAMLIWLSKNYLKMSDKSEVEMVGASNVSITFASLKKPVPELEGDAVLYSQQKEEK